MNEQMEKSLEELENDKWGAPSFGSHLANECHRLRLVPIKTLSVDNLRMLIGQNIGLKYLVPLALDRLEIDPLAKGEMYRGDLLANVAAIDEDFWINNPDLNNRLVDIGGELKIIARTISDELMPLLDVYRY